MLKQSIFMQKILLVTILAMIVSFTACLGGGGSKP